MEEETSGHRALASKGNPEGIGDQMTSTGLEVYLPVEKKKVSF
jgi:hypothetical protein